MYEAFQLKSVADLSDDERVGIYQRFHVMLSLLLNRLVAVTNASSDSGERPRVAPGVRQRQCRQPRSASISRVDAVAGL
ncbi:hypothetical protein PINS_up022089 [Pythium insidiosum]|nr:hypothetical protein PINS_up022089 [Pythium insidiosum]